VVVVSAGAEGDTQKDLVLTEARARIVREYLVENFGFDVVRSTLLGLARTRMRIPRMAGGRYRS